MKKIILNLSISFFILLMLGALGYLVFIYFWQKPNQTTIKTQKHKKPNQPIKKTTKDKKPNQSITKTTKDKKPNQSITKTTKDKKPNQTITKTLKDKKSNSNLQFKKGSEPKNKNILIKKNSLIKPKKINIFSKYFLTKTFEDFTISNWKQAIIMQYSQNKKSNSLENEEKKPNFVFQTDLFQKIVIQAIAKKLNFEDLMVVFEYSEQFKKVKVKIAFAKKNQIFIEKNYEIKQNF